MPKKRISGIIILLACIASLFAFVPSQPLLASATSYERQSLNLLEKLKAGDYDALERFFQQSHTEKKRFVNGRNAAYGVFSSWYLSKYHVTPELLTHINGWIKQYPESAFAYLTRAEFYYQQAWKARGGKWAHLTTRDQWNRYYASLGKAHADITQQVLPRNPAIAFAYERLIAIMAQTNGYFDAGTRNTESAEFLQNIMKSVAGEYVALQQQKALLKKAQSHGVDDMYGVHHALMLFGMAPRWGGSAEQMLHYARDIAKSAPANSTLPMLLLFAHNDLARSLSTKKKKAYYAKPGVWKEVKWAFEVTHSAYPKGAQWMVAYAKSAYDAGKYRLSGEYMNRAYYADPSYSPTYLKMGAMYMKNTSSHPVAEKTYKEFLQLRQDDYEPYRQLAYIRIKQNKFDEAIAFADKGIAIEPQRCILWAHRCLANFKKGDYDQGAKDCSHIIGVDPYCKLAYKHRSKILKALGNHDASSNDMQTYKRLKGK